MIKMSQQQNDQNISVEKKTDQQKSINR